MTSSFLSDLRERGLVHQQSSDELDHALERDRLAGYIGFDPTASSLHIGSLLQILTLVRFQRAGHRPIVLVGGGTGLIGDPSGKEAERSMRTREEVEANSAKIAQQLGRFLDFGEGEARMVDNAEWLDGLPLVEFLRDIGKHFSVNQMVVRDSVRMRLERPDQGISFTEFTYMLLQAYDFLELYRRYGCTIQMGGSDQWGNMVSGSDLIRRLEGASAYAVTSPLITRSDGKKFGKTEQGNVWLDAEWTTPYEFYQFWLNVQDREAGPYLRFFTLRDVEDIKSIEKQADAAPEKRELQTVLAQDLTAFVHGKDALRRAERATHAFFGQLEWSELSAQELAEAFHNVPQTACERGDLGTDRAGILHVLAQSELYPSRGRARKDVEGGAIRINGRQQTDSTYQIGAEDLLGDRYVVLRRGKKTYHVIEYR